MTIARWARPFPDGRPRDRRGHNVSCTALDSAPESARPAPHLETDLRFVKYHGLGNDFIVLVEGTPTPELATRLCRRGFSIGADGVMAVSPPSPGVDAHVRMDLINSDGSLPEMCGNGIRCLVKDAIDRLGYRQNPLRVETPAGVLACEWVADEHGVSRVRVAMSRPTFELHAVPVDPGAGRTSGAWFELELDSRPVVGLPVNTGNPHFVVFGDASRERALSDGPRLENHPAFPKKANIEFAEVLSPTHLKVTVWERGCGLTLACGTGATASTAAAIRAGHAAADTPVTVSLPGGDLLITVSADFSSAIMDGPVEKAFEGELAP